MAARAPLITGKNGIHCPRCNGLMGFEKFYAPQDSFSGWHCLLCGEILDSVILLHRFTQDAQVKIPEKEEERVSLIKEYVSIRSKSAGAGNGERPRRNHVNPTGNIDAAEVLGD